MKRKAVRKILITLLLAAAACVIITLLLSHINFAKNKQALLNAVVPLSEAASIEINYYDSLTENNFSTAIKDDAEKKRFLSDLTNSLNSLQTIHKDNYEFIPRITVNILTEKGVAQYIRVYEISKSSFMEFNTDNRCQTITADSAWLAEYLRAAQ